MIPVNRPVIDSSDLNAVVSALEESLISGETRLTTEMETLLSKIVNTSYAVAVSNGTVALDLVIEGLEIQKNQHCILPNFTIISTVSNLVRKGAKLEFIDSDPLTWSMDANATVSAIREYTKLVLPVHIYGLPVDLDPIFQVTSKQETFVVEDSAEALGVNYKDKPCGSFGFASTFSFYANKIVTGGEGGAITTNDKDLYQKLRKLRNLSHSEERFVHYNLGWNSRITGLSAALIISQLKRLDDLKNRKLSIARQYLHGLTNHPWLSFMPDKVKYSKNLYWVFPILLNDDSPFDAPELQKELLNLGIETRRFFCPMSLQPVLRNANVMFNSDNKISERIWKKGLYLPSGLGITEGEIDYCIEKIWNLVK